MTSDIEDQEKYVSRVSIPYEGLSSPGSRVSNELAAIPEAPSPIEKNLTASDPSVYENDHSTNENTPANSPEETVVKFRKHNGPERPNVLSMQKKDARPLSLRATTDSCYSGYGQQKFNRFNSTAIGINTPTTPLQSPTGNFRKSSFQKSVLYANDHELVREASKVLEKFHQKKQNRIIARQSAWIKATQTRESREEFKRLTSSSRSSQNKDQFFFGEKSFDFSFEEDPDMSGLQGGIGAFGRWDPKKVDEEQRGSRTPSPQKHAKPATEVAPLKKQKKSSKFCKILGKIYRMLGLNHVLLIMILLGYAVLGAFVFLYLEQPSERAGIAKAREDAVSRHIKYAAMFANLVENNCTNETWLPDNETNGAAITEVPGSVISSTVSYGGHASNETASNETECEKWLKAMLRQYDEETGLADLEELPKPPLYAWDFWNAMFFAGTLFTTIGYGNISCKTFYGRIATIIYASIGIPLMLTVLNDLGKLVFVCARNGWNKLMKCINHLIIFPWRMRNATPEAKTARLQSMASEETEMDIDHNFPLPLALVIVFLYTFLCATIFVIWEHNWDYFTAFYFFFISLSTIGLGDVLPDNPKFTTATFGLFIVGLALVSMCINVMQAKVEARYMAALELIEEAYLDDDLEVGSVIEDEGYRKPRLNSSSSYDGDHRASLGILQVQRRASRNSSKKGGSSFDVESPISPKLKVIAERDEKTTNL